MHVIFFFFTWYVKLLFYVESIKVIPSIYPYKQPTQQELDIQVVIIDRVQNTDWEINVAKGNLGKVKI